LGQVDVPVDVDLNVRAADVAVGRRLPLLLLPRIRLLLLLPRISGGRLLLPGFGRRRLLRRGQDLAFPVGTIGRDRVGAPRPEVLNDVHLLPAQLGRRHHQAIELVARDDVLVRDAPCCDRSEEGQCHEADDRVGSRRAPLAAHQRGRVRETFQGS
jgi:hypothetical protein